MDFMMNTGLAVVLVIAVQIIMMKFLYKKSTVATEEARAKVMALDENKSITDARLMKIGIVLIGLIIIGFLAHDKARRSTSCNCAFSSYNYNATERKES